MKLLVALGATIILLLVSACSSDGGLATEKFPETRPLVASATELSLVPVPEGTSEAASLSAVGRGDLIERPDLNGVCEPYGGVGTGLSNVYEEIVRRAETKRLVVINEAHDVPEHRAFFEALLPYLRQAGFDHLAMEAIAAGALPSESSTASLTEVANIEKLGHYFGDPRPWRSR